MLKSDRWIRKMSKEHDMINPFSEKGLIMSCSLDILRIQRSLLSMELLGKLIIS